MPTDLGSRIREARERIGLTQATLAKRANLSSHQIISEIELGNREIKAFELAQIARALCLDINAFLVIGEPASARVLWRDKPAAAGEKEAAFLRICKQYMGLRKVCGVSSTGTITGENVVSSYAEAEKLAEEVRKNFGLGRYPAKELAHILEDDFDVLIKYSDLGSEGSSACSSGAFGNAILVNSQEAPWRRNFDIAHELFHLLTWHTLESEDDCSEEIERLSNVFASNLLLPAEQVSVEIEKSMNDEKCITWIDMIELARKFDVSTEALLWRLRGLRYLDQKVAQELLGHREFRALDKSSMNPHWWDPPELPEKYVRVAFLAYVKERISKSKLAELLETNLIGLQRKLAEYGLVETQDLQTSVHTC